MKSHLQAPAAETANPFRLPSGSSLEKDSTESKLIPPAARIREILVPIDFSEHSTIVLRYALELAEQFGAAITLINVIEPPLVNPETIYYTANSDQIIQTAENMLVQLCRREKQKQPLMRQTVVRSGTPCEKIVETARIKKVDLIIIGTHGRTGLAHILLGSTAEKVIRHAPCPVLVVRLNRQDYESTVKTN